MGREEWKRIVRQAKNSYRGVVIREEEEQEQEEEEEIP
jgi:hypothetical protein